MNTQDDKVFQEVAQILNDNKINYWLCHGTLLGVIRENRLLPWDLDIDIAIWDDEYSKEDILKLFYKNENFQQTTVLEEMDNLHFLAAEKMVDINFYHRDNNKAFIKWPAPGMGSILLKMYHFVVTFMNSDFSFRYTTEASTKTAKLIKIILSGVLAPVKVLLPRSAKQNIYNDLANQKLYTYVKDRTNYTGYSYPLDLMKFKKINFLGVDVFVPIESEMTLEITYGKGWKVPKKDYIWYKEAENLL